MRTATFDGGGAVATHTNQPMSKREGTFAKCGTLMREFVKSAIF